MDASRRSAAAQRTREQIVAAAFHLHGEGVVQVEELARAARVSVATGRKRFPNREILFENCTAFGLSSEQTRKTMSGIVLSLLPKEPEGRKPYRPLLSPDSIATSRNNKRN